MPNQNPNLNSDNLTPVERTWLVGLGLAFAVAIATAILILLIGAVAY